MRLLLCAFPVRNEKQGDPVLSADTLHKGKGGVNTQWSSSLKPTQQISATAASDDGLLLGDNMIDINFSIQMQQNVQF